MRDSATAKFLAVKRRQGQAIAAAFEAKAREQKPGRRRTYKARKRSS